MKKEKSKGGRNVADNPAIFRYNFRLNSNENAAFESQFLKSGVKDKTTFIKAILFNRPIKVIKVDKAAMDYYMRLTTLYSQYQKIGVNYNQTVKALKANFGEKKALYLLYRLEKLTIELITISKQVIQLTQEFEEKWLRK
ncbi:MAG: MobA protein [Bacteroides sp.]|nr:MobA protein [Bacteroides sp.]